MAEVYFLVPILVPIGAKIGSPGLCLSALSYSDIALKSTVSTWFF